MSARPGSSYILRLVVVNVFLMVGLYQLWRNGHLTGGMIALYVGFFLVANTFIYFGARARSRLLNR